VDVTAKVALVGIEGRDRTTFRGREKLRQNGAAILVEVAGDRLPVMGGDPRLCGLTAESRDVVKERTFM
jgi:hypothetical protein